MKDCPQSCPALEFCELNVQIDESKAAMVKTQYETAGQNTVKGLAEDVALEDSAQRGLLASQMLIEQQLGKAAKDFIERAERWRQTSRNILADCQKGPKKRLLGAVICRSENIWGRRLDSHHVKAIKKIRHGFTS